jgi:hypothetical protein
MALRELSVAIYMDKPTLDGWAHLISDLSGKPGQEELYAFARDGFLPRRRHRSGTYAEHLDIRGSEIIRAEAAGARTITRRQLARILKAKRLSGRTGEDTSSLLVKGTVRHPLMQRS